MAFCAFSRDGAMYDSTPIENMFLLEYLPTAPDGFLRVYLYARMLCTHPELGESLEDMARALRMDEDQVFTAMAYWEQQGLAERISDRPPTYALLPLRSGLCEGVGADRDYYTYREYNSSLQAIFGANDLLAPKQYKIANDWLNVLGFTQEAALCLLEYEKSLPGGKKPASVFKRADKQAIEWAECGVKTLEQVQAAIADHEIVEGLCRRVLERLGIRRSPTEEERACVRRWVNDWKLTEQTVIAACEETTKSRQPSIGYLDAILKKRVENGADRYFKAVQQLLREMGVPNAQPTPEQLQRYDALIADGAEPDTIALAAAQCGRRGKRTFDDLEWMIGKWSEMGVRSRSDAEKYIADMQKTTAEVRGILERAGLTRRPNMDDIARYEGWKRTAAPELIQYAAELAAGTRNPMIYIGKLVSEWEKSGVRDASTARAEHDRRGAQKYAPAQNVHNYQQHTYTEADFGPDFFYDPTRDNPMEDTQK